MLYDQKRESLSILHDQKLKKDQAADAEVLIRRYCAEMQKALETLDTEGKRRVLTVFGVKVEATVTTCWSQ